METMASSWTVTGLTSDDDNAPKVRICDGNPVLGGPEIVSMKGSFSRTYDDLPSHNTIYLDIGVKMIGGWTGSKDAFNFLIDGEQVASIAIGKVGTKDGVNSCGGSGKKDLDTRLVGNISHTADSVTLKFTWELKTKDSTGSFAINDVSLIFSSDTLEDSLVFLNLVDTSVTITPSGNPTGKTTCKTGYYWEDDDCLECDEACQDCFGASSSECYQCAMDYNFIEDKCQKCGSDCTLCSDVGDGNCLLCNYGFTLEEDGTCTEDVDPTHDCVSAYTYQYENGTCDTDCPAPYREKYEDKVGFFCKEPCYDFLYQNDSCLETCPSPYKVAKTDASEFCNLPCSDGQYYYRNKTCAATCDFEEFYEDMEDNVLICEEICTLTSNKNGSKVTTCPNVNCTTISDFYFPQAQDEEFCRPLCPYGFFANKSAICINPCDLETYLYADGRCLGYCLPGFTPREEGGFKFCDNIMTATVQMYVRYDISLTAWTSEKYEDKFIALIAKLLEISSSDIKVLRTTSGSTIVEAEAVIKSGSTVTLKSKATDANQKLNDAAKAGELDIEGTAVLDSNFNIVMDEVTEPEQRHVTLETSSSKTVGMAVGVGAGVVVLGAIIVGVRVYRFKMIQREARERDENREITYRAKDMESLPSPSQVTSANNSRNYLQSSNSRRRLKKTSVY